MYKTDIINAVSAKTRLSKRLVERVIDCLFAEITAALADGEPVRFTGFGAFDTQLRSPRTGRDISTGAQVPIPSRVVPVFKPGRFLKAAVQNRR